MLCRNELRGTAFLQITQFVPSNHAICSRKSRSRLLCRMESLVAPAYPVLAGIDSPRWGHRRETFGDQFF